jgi:tripeptidyl-peptidase-1
MLLIKHPCAPLCDAPPTLTSDLPPQLIFTSITAKMRYIDILAIGVACLNACDALPSSSLAKYAVHEKRDSTGWRAAQTLKKRDRVHIARSLPVRIGLAQRDLDLGHDWLMDIAHPSSPNYGKHWTSQQVNKAFAPTAETVQTVRDWLINSGIAASRISVSDNKGWLGFDATIEEAESLFQAQYYEHEHPDANKYTVGCDE